MPGQRCWPPPDEVWRCGEDSPDVLQRRYTALGLGWRDPIEEESPEREDPSPRVVGEPPDRVSEWLTVEEAADLAAIAVTTLKNGEWRRAARPGRGQGQPAPAHLPT